MNTKSLSTTALLSALVGMIVFIGVQRYYEQRITLYKQRLVETTEHIHDLEHELEEHTMVGDGHHHDHHDHHDSHGGMQHEILPLDDTEWRPTVNVEVLPDPETGWNVQLITTDFTFAPTQASGEHQEGYGHAHLYIDGVKVNRVYSEWYHVSTLEPGTHEVRVTLNSNDHNDLMINGEMVEASTTVEVIAE